MEADGPEAYERDIDNGILGWVTFDDDQLRSPGIIVRPYVGQHMLEGNSGLDSQDSQEVGLQI